MGSNENKEILKNLADILSSGDMSKVNEVLDDNFSYRSTAGEEIHGPEAMMDFFGMYEEAFSDFNTEWQDMVAEGDTVYFQYRQTGTHSGEFWGIPASNNKMDILVTSRAKLKNGKLVEVYDSFDTMELLKQLDALPEESTRKLEEFSNRMPGRRM